MPTNAATEPTDRSMWPAMMTITMPMARIRMYEYCCTTLITLVGSRVSPPDRISNSTMITTSAMTMLYWPIPRPPVRARRAARGDFVGVVVVLIGRLRSFWSRSC
jgi:hypothetical protein